MTPEVPQVLLTPLALRETVDFLIEHCNLPLRLKILMPGAKNRRQALRSHTPALSHPGEGVNLLASIFALPSEKIDSHWSWRGNRIGSLEIPSGALSLTRERVRVWVSAVRNRAA